MQRKCVLTLGPLRFYPNLYVVLIAPPGKVQKGTAMDPVMQFLEEPQLNIHLAAEAVTREQLIRELSNASDTITLSDGRMMSHCSLTICNSELTVFLGYNNIQMLSDLNDWYDCKRRWTYRTKNSGSDEVKSVWVNLLGATTPALIRSSLPMDTIGGGLASRIIFVYAGEKRQMVIWPEITPEEERMRECLINDLERIVAMHGEFSTTKQFKELWTEWRILDNSNPPFQDEIFSGYCGRRPATMLKLCTIMSASHTDSMVIDDIDLMRAIMLLEEVEQTMPMALSGIGRGEHADVLSKLMSEIALYKECDTETLMWKFRNDLTKWEMDKMLATLEAMGFCDYITNTHHISYRNGFNM